MIHEYAIDPEFLFELLDKPDMASALCRALKGGTGCVTSGYPDEMGEKAYTLAKERADSATDPKHKAKWQERISQITQLAAELTHVSTKRYHTHPWQQSFAPEHKRFPFQGILSGKAEQDLPINHFAWLRGRDCHLFTCTGNCLVTRNADALNTALTPLLQNAETITFIDPYFSGEQRFQDSYKLYFKTIASANHVRASDERVVTIICAVNTGKNMCLPHEFAQMCQSMFPRLVPTGLKLHIHRIKGVQGSQEIHNRYILTDIGGVAFGHGTDASGSHSYDDIRLLAPHPLAHWKNAYTPGSSAFDWSEPPVVVESSRSTS